MNEWPIIKQITMIIAFFLKCIYSAFSMIGIDSVVLTVIGMTVLFKLITTPLVINQFKTSAVQKKMSDKIGALRDLYGNDDIPIFKTKLKVEMDRLNNKYSINKMSGCLTFLIQFPVIVGLYYVVSNTKTYIPELADSSFTLCGINMSMTPSMSFTKEYIVLVTVFFSQLFQNFVNQKINTGKIKVNFSSIFSATFSFMLAVKLPLLISVYWTTQALCSILQTYIIHNCLKNKPLEYFEKASQKKINLIRAKKGLPAIIFEEGDNNA